MNTRPKTLRLADKLEAYYEDRFYNEEKEAAAELRRLHQSEREGWRYAAELEQTRKELLEALKYVIDAWVEGNGSEWNQSDSSAKACAAIARAESTLKTE